MVYGMSDDSPITEDSDPFETDFAHSPSGEVDKPDPSAPATSAAAAGGRRKAARAASRRAIRQALILSGVSARKRDELAVLIGSKHSDVENLAMAALEANRTALRRPIADVLAVADAEDPWTAMTEATGWAMAADQSRFRAAWAALSRVCPDLPASAPLNPAKAGSAFARAASALSQESRAALSAPLDLLVA